MLAVPLSYRLTLASGSICNAGDSWLAPLLHGFVHTPRLVVFGGGFPIVEDGAVIGAIGLSGGHYSQDMECARAALKAVGFTPND